MNINTITAEDLRRMPDKEGLILQGCGGDLTEWVDGINEMLTHAGILKDGCQFENVAAFQHGELTCLLYPFDDVKLDIGKLALWRLQTHEVYGGTWLSDFVPNYLGGFIETPEALADKPDCPLIGADGNIFNLLGIDAALEEKPKDFEELLQKLETAGLEVNRERKHLRFRVPGQENYTRCDTLKGDYTEQAIKERIAGTRTVKPRHAFSKKTVSKVGLLVDIEAAIRSGKGPGYERWAKVFNLKQLSQAVLYLKEHGDMGYEDLLEKANATTTNFNTLSVQIKDLESKMNANAELQKQIVNYAKTRAVYVEYRKAGYSKKFRTEHEAEILLHQAAKNHFDELGIKKLPSVKSLREEYTDLLEQKRKAYACRRQLAE